MLRILVLFMRLKLPKTMNRLQKLIDKSKYQVFFMHSGCNFPALFFVTHNWIVVNNKGKLSRWETGYTTGRGKENWGHLRKNDKYYTLFSGIQMISGLPWPLWKGRVSFVIEGEPAGKIIETVEGSPKHYPYSKDYGLFGPNSNTFVQWVLEQHSDIHTKLPRNAVGKNYKKK